LTDLTGSQAGTAPPRARGGEAASEPRVPFMADDQVDFVCEALSDVLRAAAIHGELIDVQ